ncbi:unnamed protein product, partial [Clonostachys rhizophaga]
MNSEQSALGESHTPPRGGDVAVPHILYGFQGCVPFYTSLSGDFLNAVRRLLSVKKGGRLPFDLIRFNRNGEVETTVSQVVRPETEDVPGDAEIPGEAETYIDEHIKSHGDCECRFFVKLQRDEQPSTFEPGPENSSVVKISTADGHARGATCYLTEDNSPDSRILRERNMEDFHVYMRTALEVLHQNPGTDINLDRCAITISTQLQHPFEGMGIAPCTAEDLSRLAQGSQSNILFTATHVRDGNVLFVPGYYPDQMDTTPISLIDLVGSMRQRLRRVFGDSEAGMIESIQYFTVDQFLNPGQIADGEVRDQRIPMDSEDEEPTQLLRDIVDSGRNHVIVLLPVWKKVTPEQSETGNDLVAGVRLPEIFTTVSEMWQWAKSIFPDAFEKSPSNMYLWIEPSSDDKDGSQGPIRGSYYVGTHTTDVEWFKIRARVATRLARVWLVNESQADWLGPKISKQTWGPRYGSIIPILASRNGRRLGNSVSPENRARGVQCGTCMSTLKCINCNRNSEEAEEEAEGDVGPLLSTDIDFYTTREQHSLVETLKKARPVVFHGGVPCPRQEECHDQTLYNSLRVLVDHILDGHTNGVLPPISNILQAVPSITQNLPDPSPAPVEKNQELAPPVAQPSSPQSQLQQNQPPPQHSSPRVESNPNPTAQAPRAYGLYSRDRTEQVGEQAEQRTRYGDPRLTAVQEQLQEQPQSQITDDDREAALVLAAMSEAQPLARTAAEERQPTPPSEEEIQSEGQGDSPEDAAGPSEPTTLTDPPFTPDPGDKCSMCLRSLPNPHKKTPKDEPSFESQWKAHVNPERNCRIPNKRGSHENLPNRSGWIGKRSRGARDAVRDAREDYRNKNKDLFGHKFYPFDGKQPYSSFWKHDPNNDDNSESWNKPWPPAIEKRLREDAAREAEAQTEAPGPSRAAASGRPTAARRRKRQEPSDNAEYRTESESDSDDDIEPDVDDTRQPKRRRVGDSTYRPLSEVEVDEADEVADSAAAPRGNARARGRTRAQARGRAQASRARAAAASGRGARGNRVTSAAAAGPAPPPEGPRRSARQRARARQ